jgi:bacterioferritin (cytochrome b1)
MKMRVRSGFFCHFIAELNPVLEKQLTASTYFLHAEMCEKWGYHKGSRLH